MTDNKNSLIVTRSVPKRKLHKIMKLLQMVFGSHQLLNPFPDPFSPQISVLYTSGGALAVGNRGCKSIVRKVSGAMLRVGFPRGLFWVHRFFFLSFTLII